MLRGADEIEVLPFYLIHHRVHLGKAHNSVYNGGADHKRRHAVGEALVYHKIARIGEHGGMKPRDIAHKIVKAVSGNAPRGVKVYAAEALHYLGVVGYLVIRHDGLAEFLQLHILAVVPSDRHIVVNYIRNGHHNFGYAGGKLALFF